jgi:hypothetical protein
MFKLLSSGQEDGWIADIPRSDACCDDPIDASGHAPSIHCLQKMDHPAVRLISGNAIEKLAGKEDPVGLYSFRVSTLSASMV